MGYNLEDKEEVKEYIRNLGIEYRFGCFSEKQPESCQLLGEFLETIEGNHEAAAKVYKANCDDHSVAKSCHRYGHLAVKGRGIPANLDEGIDYHARACSLGERRACSAGGAAAAERSVNKELPDAARLDYGKRALELLGLGCSQGDGFACFYLSGAHLQGTRVGGVARDMAQAFSYSQQACDLGHPVACANLSQMYARGDGTAADPAKALALRKKADAMRAKHNENVKLQRVNPTDGGWQPGA